MGNRTAMIAPKTGMQAVDVSLGEQGYDYVD